MDITAELQVLLRQVTGPGTVRTAVTKGPNVMHLVGADVVAMHLDNLAHCGPFLQSFEKTITCTTQEHAIIDILSDLMPAF